MTPHEIAKSKLGLKEIPGPLHNDEIIAMFAKVGHSWVKDDETAWCAAFVGWAIEMAGGKSTRKLDARSYLEWGVGVGVDNIQRGDIGVWPRGKGWQGHVGFVERVEGDKVWLNSGNQSDAVTVKAYPIATALGFRRATNAPKVSPQNIVIAGLATGAGTLATTGNIWPAAGLICAAVAAFIIWKRMKR